MKIWTISYQPNISTDSIFHRLIEKQMRNSNTHFAELSYSWHPKLIVELKLSSSFREEHINSVRVRDCFILLYVFHMNKSGFWNT